MIQTMLAPVTDTGVSCPQDAQRFRMLFSNAPIGLSLVDRDMRYLQVNPAMCALLGYAESELIGHRFVEFTHPDDVAADVGQTLALLRGETTCFRVDKRYLRKDGQLVWAKVTVSVVAEPGQASNCVISMVEDITAVKLAEQGFLDEVRQHRNTLVREVQHRIKNNLQGVVGLLQQHAYEYPELKSIMDKAVSRVGAIAMVHGLHGDDTKNAVNLCNITREVTRSIGNLYQVQVPVELPQGFVPVEVNPDETVPIALIINELVQNAFNHALSADARQLIRIKVWREGEGAVVEIENTGTALPRGFDFAQGLALGTGLSLVRSLMPKTGARLDFVAQDRQRLTARLRLWAPVLYSSNSGAAGTP